MIRTLEECFRHYRETQGRPPTTLEIWEWKDAPRDCRGEVMDL